MNKDIVLDLDGVIFDFEHAFCKKFGFENRHMTCLESRYPEQADAITVFTTATRTYRELDIIPDGVKIARFCKNEGFKIHVITSRPFYMEDMTREVLKQNGIPFDTLSVAEDWENPKIARIRKIEPLFAVDDMLSIVEKCADYGIPSFLMNSEWNQKEELDGSIHRVGNFDEFLAKYTMYFD